MEKVLNVAQYLFDEYKRETQELIDELKLHKLLYFAQRENYAIYNEPLFSEDMEGWTHGPVSPQVRNAFISTVGMVSKPDDINFESKQLIKNIISEYGHVESWALRNLSHDEISWKNSRIGLMDGERGKGIISKDDIAEDSKKVRPFDYTWGMYYDEFDDAEGAPAV